MQQALNRWIEESLDAMSEVLAVDNPTEADRAQAELEASQAELECVLPTLSCAHACPSQLALSSACVLIELLGLIAT